MEDPDEINRFETDAEMLLIQQPRQLGHVPDRRPRRYGEGEEEPPDPIQSQATVGAILDVERAWGQRATLNLCQAIDALFERPCGKPAENAADEPCRRSNRLGTLQLHHRFTGSLGRSPGCR